MHSGYFPVFLLLFAASLLESIVCGHSFNHLPSFRQPAQIDSISMTPLKQPSSRSLSVDLHVAKPIILFWHLLKLFGSLWPCWLQGQHPPWNSSLPSASPYFPDSLSSTQGPPSQSPFWIIGCWFQHIVCFSLSQGLVPGHRQFLICLSVFPVWSYLVPWLWVPPIC